MFDYKPSRRRFLTVSSAVLGTAVLGGAEMLLEACAGTSNTGATVKKGGTLTMGMAGDPPIMDPHRATQGVYHHTVRSTVFEGLTHVKQDLSQEPRLAESWTTSSDGLTVTFKLRQGVTFHDGSPFTAQDVVFNIQRIQDKSFGSAWAPYVNTVEQVTAVDDHTVRFQLSVPTPALFANLGSIMIISQKSAGTIDKHPVGTGPFQFVEWVPGDHIKVTKFANYWQAGKPYLDGILFKPLPDAQSAVTALQTGGISLLEDTAPQYVQTVQSMSNVAVSPSPPILQLECYQFNTQRFADKRVRQALSYAFPRKDYVQSFWYNLSRPSVNFFVKEMPVYLPDSDDLTASFDVSKANSLLQQAGYTKDNPLKIEILTPNFAPTRKQGALLLQNNLNQLGHKVTIADVETSTWVDRIEAHAQYDVTVVRYDVLPADPSGIFNSEMLSPSFNLSRWSTSDYADKVAGAAKELDTQKRISDYQDLQRLVLDEVPIFTINHMPIIPSMLKTVKGLVVGPDAVWDYSAVSIS